MESVTLVKMDERRKIILWLFYFLLVASFGLVVSAMQSQGDSDENQMSEDEDVEIYLAKRRHKRQENIVSKLSTIQTQSQENKVGPFQRVPYSSKFQRKWPV